ncbi:hypothetical protein NL676_029152 [Syzygium grande]|nr:hypothetical protein NL676_029152 [Syzygium grande]
MGPTTGRGGVGIDVCCAFPLSPPDVKSRVARYLPRDVISLMTGEPLSHTESQQLDSKKKKCELPLRYSGRGIFLNKRRRHSLVAGSVRFGSELQDSRKRRKVKLKSQNMGRGVSAGGGQSSLGYLFGSGEAGKPTEHNGGAPTKGSQANNYFRADGPNSSNFITDRPSTKVHAAPGGGSSLGCLFGGGGNGN